MMQILSYRQVIISIFEKHTKGSYVITHYHKISGGSSIWCFVKSDRIGWSYLEGIPDMSGSRMALGAPGEWPKLRHQREIPALFDRLAAQFS